MVRQTDKQTNTETGKGVKHGDVHPHLLRHAAIQTTIYVVSPDSLRCSAQLCAAVARQCRPTRRARNAAEILASTEGYSRWIWSEFERGDPALEIPPSLRVKSEIKDKKKASPVANFGFLIVNGKRTKQM